MRILSAEESAAWLRSRGVRRGSVPTARDRWRLLWPEEPSQRGRLKALADGLSRLSGWKGAVLILANSGMPRESGVAEVAALRAAGDPSTMRAEVLTNAPGHHFDDEPERNQALVASLLGAMMSGYLEGTLATKDARFVASVGCGVIEVASSDRSMSGRLRSLVRELQIQTI